MSPDAAVAMVLIVGSLAALAIWSLLTLARWIDRRAEARCDRMVRAWEVADLTPYLFDAAEFVDHVQSVRSQLDRHEFEMSVLADIEHIATRGIA